MAQATVSGRQIRIGDYLLIGKIGQGGNAQIFKARQESLGREVAIKVLSAKLSDDPEIVRRFERESIVIAGLNHPNIVHIIDKGTAGNRYYFVMEYIEGSSMREVIDSTQIELKTKLEMLVEVLKALDYAHKNGVIHRDIKPANVLVDKQGNARVADFGIAQIVGVPDGELTAVDLVMGTLSYMSPEQKVSSTNVDQTTDIFAVGIMLYEILVHKKPEGRFKLPSEINPRIPKAYDKLIQKCLAQDPKDRFQTAVALKDGILEAIGGRDPGAEQEELPVSETQSFMGKCRYLDTVKETEYGSTILVENRISKKLYVIKKHTRGSAGRKEAKLLTSLKHPNIINVFGAGGSDNSTVLITDYAQGGSLADRMVRKYDWEKTFEIGIAIASGLDFAHKNNIIHANLRPSNILFDAEETVKLADFGLPQHYDDINETDWYSPPERQVSRQGDLYSLGVILHQMLTNRIPSYDDSNQLLIEDSGNAIPVEVKSVLTRLLAITVQERFQSAEEFLHEWKQAMQRRKDRNKIKPSLSQQAPAPITAPRTPWWMWIALVLSTTIATSLVLYILFNGK